LNKNFNENSWSSRELEEEMKNHVLNKAQLIGLYQKII